MPLSPPLRYLTLAATASAEIEVRRSRFLCEAAPATSEEAARAFIEQVRAGSRDARHHCTAFVLGPEGATVRSNDDGEPSGTAGAPMLDVLRGRGLTDVVAVVARWFGGTLLGTGGLIRAYGEAVTAALEGATLLTMELREGLIVDGGRGRRAAGRERLARSRRLRRHRRGVDGHRPRAPRRGRPWSPGRRHRARRRAHVRSRPGRGPGRRAGWPPDGTSVAQGLRTAA